MSRGNRLDTLLSVITSPSRLKPIPRESMDVIRDGYVRKESQYLRISRKRWMVLTPQYLYSYKSKKALNSQCPTEVIDLTIYNKIKHDNKKKFEIICRKTKHKRKFVAKTHEEMIYWFNNIQNMQCFRNIHY